MENKTKQIDFWEGDFGKEYTDRNNIILDNLDDLYLELWNKTRSEMNTIFLENIDKNIKILEVGTNLGQQLQHLQRQGFKNLYGIELQSYAVEKAKNSTKEINIIQGSCFDIPFKDNYFDLVFTSGVLIHISPNDLEKAMTEIYRCSNKYIWGFEYFSDNLEELNYRENTDYMWKQDFAKLYLTYFSDLKLIKEEKYKYNQDNNVDSMFLLSK